ncbi:MAG: VIT and VWA domain-containing protein [Mariniblastus sp.]|nr:VIT and VWA domain-containing protein [Mariniblastus sp.]
MSVLLRTFVGAVMVVSLGSLLPAQGILLPDRDHREHFVLPQPGRPVPPTRTSYCIEKLAIDATIQGQLARTSVSQTFRNTGSRQMEVCFVFPLPYDGAVDKLTFLVNGRELEAKLMDAKQARDIYEGYVRRNQDPALLEWVGTGMFKTSVFPIPAGEKRTVTLQYSQLLRKQGDVMDYLFPLVTAKYTAEPVESIDFRVAISADADLKNIYSPSHEVQIERDDERNAVVKYSRTNVIPQSDFRLVAGAANQDIGANVISYWPEDADQGYFILLASPKIEAADMAPQSKNVVFVVDRSGSMNGKKIEQARNAAKYVMNNLRQNDHFNVIAYDTDVESYLPELERFTDETRPGGVGFVNSIHSGGGTNIDGALARALGDITDTSSPSYVVFLTDGLPTVGETNEMRIVRNAVQRNAHRSRLISFGVGYDVNSRLLDRLTRENYGQSEYVRPDENVESAVSRLFDKISSPVLTDVAIEYDFDVRPTENGSAVNRVYPSGSFDLFAGQQMVIVGRYRDSGTAKLKISGQVAGEQQAFEFNVNFAQRGGGESNRYVEKLWANRRIGEIIDQIDLNGKNQELMDELIRLAKRHGIVTPYTSFLADENQDAANFASQSDNRATVDAELDQLEESSGEGAFKQRAGKQWLKNAQKAAPAAANAGMGFGEDEGGQALRRNQGRTVYRKGKILIADNVADVDLHKEADRIVEVSFLGEDYFKLLKENSVEENRLMANQRAGEELIIRLRGQVYRIK